MNPKRMRWDALADRLTDGKLYGAEIGVWKGRMSAQLLRRFPLLTLIMVDRWCPPPAGDSYLTSGSTMARQDARTFKSVYQEAVMRVAFAGRRADIVRGDSAESAGKIRDGTLDFVFVDGDHSYAGVTRDIEAWIGKVKRGGLIGGHDYAHPDQGDVKRAVHDWFGSEVEIDVDRTWWVRL